METINEIHIWAPRWRDRVVLVADWKIAKGDTRNKIIIDARRKDGTPFYPEPFFMTSEKIKECPEEFVNGKKMRAVKLDDLLNGAENE